MRRIAKRKKKQEVGKPMTFEGCPSGESSPADPKKTSKTERKSSHRENEPVARSVKSDQNTNEKRHKKKDEPKTPRDPA